MKIKWIALVVVSICLLVFCARTVQNWNRHKVLNDRLKVLLSEIEERGGEKKSGPLGLIFDLSDSSANEEWLLSRIDQLISADELRLPRRLETPSVVLYLEENQDSIPAKVSFVPHK